MSDSKIKPDVQLNTNDITITAREFIKAICTRDTVKFLKTL
jgi:hypothetical protein